MKRTIRGAGPIAGPHCIDARAHHIHPMDSTRTTPPQRLAVPRKVVRLMERKAPANSTSRRRQMAVSLPYVRMQDDGPHGPDPDSEPGRGRLGDCY